MSKLIGYAAIGQRRALQTLYEAHKKEACFIAECLLCNKAAAEEAVLNAFKSSWKELQRLALSEESEYVALLIRKTVEYCKKKAMKADAKAFRIPQNRNFALFSFAPANTTGTNGCKILASLPVLHRYIFVLRHICDYDISETAKILNTDFKTVQYALDAEQSNMERLLKALVLSEQIRDSIGEIKKDESRVTVSAETDGKIGEIINEMALPLEKKQRKKWIVLSSALIASVLILGGIVCFVVAQLGNSDTQDADASGAAVVEETDEEEIVAEETDEDLSADSSLISTPVIDLEEDTVYYADIAVENYGTITVQLDQASAPVTVANFVNLAQNGFYDGLTFHRIIDGFVMQGGDPNGDGTGGSDNCIVGEFTDNGYDNSLSHTRGAISMARSSDYDSGSSQFFICQEDCSDSLDGQYAVFGYVTEGLDIVDAVCTDAEPTDSNGTISADAQPIITSVTIWTE